MKDGETAAAITTMSVRTEGNLSHPPKKRQQPHSLIITGEAPASLKEEAGWEISAPNRILTEHTYIHVETQYPAFYEGGEII